MGNIGNVRTRTNRCINQKRHGMETASRSISQIESIRQLLQFLEWSALI